MLAAPVIHKINDSTVRQICLINPPSSFLLDERVFVGLGLLKVASVLEANAYYVNYLDLSGYENFLEALHSFLITEQAQIVGITATTPQMPSVIQILKIIRQVWPEVRVILGGPHVTLIYAARKLELQKGNLLGRAGRAAQELEAAFDVLCAGDGERAIFAALEPDAPKFIDADDHKSPLFLTDESYEATPMPARHLIDLPSYHYQIDGHAATNLIAQLGCPFGCGFCGGRNSKSLRLIRNRSSESVVNEIEFLHRTYGYTGFMFYDDELNVNTQLIDLMNKISDLQERLGVDFRLRGFVKSELFTEGQARAMYRAGFRWLLCGFEAADPRILQNIDKRATLDDNTRMMETSHRFGLKVKALMSCGHPGESERTVMAIRDWLISRQVDDFDVTIITPYPGTPYYDRATPHESLPHTWTYVHSKTGDRLHSLEVDYLVTADYYKGIPGGGYEAFVFTDELSAADLVRLRDMVESDVRKILSIPFNQNRSSRRFEHSMGQGLANGILRRSGPSEYAKAL